MTIFDWFLLICLALFIVSAAMSYDRRQTYLKLKAWWAQLPSETRQSVLPGLKAYWEVGGAKPTTLLGVFLTEIGGAHEKQP